MSIDNLRITSMNEYTVHQWTMVDNLNAMVKGNKIMMIMAINTLLYKF